MSFKGDKPASAMANPEPAMIPSDAPDLEHVISVSGQVIHVPPAWQVLLGFGLAMLAAMMAIVLCRRERTARNKMLAVALVIIAYQQVPYALSVVPWVTTNGSFPGLMSLLMPFWLPYLAWLLILAYIGSRLREAERRPSESS